MLFLVMLRCMWAPSSSPQRDISCGWFAAFHAYGSKFIYEKHTAPMQGSAGASLCQFAWRSLFRAGLLTQAVYVCRAFPNRFSGILRPTRPLQRRVRAGFSPGFPLSRPPSGGTWNLFILFFDIITPSLVCQSLPCVLGVGNFYQ